MNESKNSLTIEKFDGRELVLQIGGKKVIADEGSSDVELNQLYAVLESAKSSVALLTNTRTAIIAEAQAAMQAKIDLAKQMQSGKHSVKGPAYN